MNASREQIKHIDYEWQNQLHKKPQKELSKFNPLFGCRVLSRKPNGKADEVELSVYFKERNIEAYLVGDCNNWEKSISKLHEYVFKIDLHGIGRVKTSNLEHKQAYKILVVQNMNIKYLQDPACVYFDDLGNCIFWDFEDPSAYQLKTKPVMNTSRSVNVLQSDLKGLIVHFRAQKGPFKGKLGHEVGEKNYYKFIATSGISEKIKKLGFNAVQFLPFAQSIDGSNWKYSYLVPFLYAIQKNWGNPDEFREMIDALHKENIGVIADSILSHIPEHFSIFGQDAMKNNGIHHFRLNSQEQVFVDDATSWGTRRPRYNDTFVRQYFIESCIHFMKVYAIDGFRVDNVDGILRYGKNGDQEDRPFGRQFLQDLNRTIYEYNPQALISFEAHFFYEDAAKMLVHPLDSNDSNGRSLGATCYNESRQTHYFHSEYMLKRSDEISAFKFADIIEEKEWGKSSSTMSDFHNHDAAAGLMSARATGAYAIECMLALSDSIENYRHSVGKIKVMEALCIALGDGRVLDLLQTFLLQKGTFEHNSAIEWHLEQGVFSKKLMEFKKEMNHLHLKEAFWPINVANRKVINVDDTNKVLAVQRQCNNEKYIIIVNLGSSTIYDYKMGMLGKNGDTLELVYDSNDAHPKEFIFEKKDSDFFKDLNVEISFHLTAYQVLVLKEKSE